jgi:hypothetical protein
VTVSVTPDEFTFVFFDAQRIAEIAAEVMAVLGLGDDLAIEVDETTPVSRVTVTEGTPVLVKAESGAFEDTRRPRHQSDAVTRFALSRVLLRLKDRREGGFAEAPPDAELTLRQVAAWDTYVLGRLGRLGLTVQEQRWRYNFRNRHGFTDAADEAFNRLWTSDGLTWGELEAICAGVGQPNSTS